MSETYNHAVLAEPISFTVTFDSTNSLQIADMNTTSYLPTTMEKREVMFTPFENHTTDLAASIYSPCSIVNCPNRANPVNAVEAVLDVFGSPSVRVRLCDDHYKLFGDADTGEREVVAENEKPDIVIDEGH